METGARAGAVDFGGPSIRTSSWTTLALLCATAVMAACGGNASVGGGPTSPPGASPTPGATPPFTLSVPAGFHITMVSNNVSGARFMAVAPNGDLLVSETAAGNVVKLNPNGPANQTPSIVARGLPRPHGLAFHNSDLYIAVWNGVMTIRNYPSGGIASLYGGLIENADHNSRSLAVSPDGSTLYESYGSNDNIATPPPQLPAENSIVAINSASGAASTYATGVRNGSGVAFDDAGQLWMVVNQRDNVSPDTTTNNANPVDEFDRVQAGGNYGYPYCYPNATSVRVPNPEYPSATCTSYTPVAFGIVAHSAPLGIVFYYGSMFPTQYRGNAFVALHGSWNSTVPHGDKVIMVNFSGGNPTGTSTDFVTGWLSGSSYLGRPTGLAVGADGALFIADDQDGYVYKVTYGP